MSTCTFRYFFLKKKTEGLITGATYISPSWILSTIETFFIAVAKSIKYKKANSHTLSCLMA